MTGKSRRIGSIAVFTLASWPAVLKAVPFSITTQRRVARSAIQFEQANIANQDRTDSTKTPGLSHAMALIHRQIIARLCLTRNPSQEVQNAGMKGETYARIKHQVLCSDFVQTER